MGRQNHTYFARHLRKKKGKEREKKDMLRRSRVFLTPPRKKKKGAHGRCPKTALVNRGRKGRKKKGKPFAPGMSLGEKV